MDPHIPIDYHANYDFDNVYFMADYLASDYFTVHYLTFHQFIDNNEHPMGFMEYHISAHLRLDDYARLKH